MTTPTPEPTPDDVGPFAFIYNPPGEPVQQWDFEPSSWTVGEMAAVERMYRKPRDEFLADVNEGYVTARRILLWIIRRRTEPDITMDDIDKLNSGYLGLYQLVTNDAGPGADDTEPEDEDPEPDAVNDPKDGQTGRSARKPASKPKQKPKQPSSRTG
jgi:hypothetical protein